MENIIKKASVLVEAIPYIHDFRRKTFVVKYGGSILEDEAIRKSVLEDVVFLSFVGIRVVLVHGGGPHVSKRLQKTGIKPEFHDGIRITDENTLKIVVEEFDKLNDRLVDQIVTLKGDVTGIKGAEHLIQVEKKSSEKDLGFVGTVTSIDREILANHLKAGHIAVVSPIGYDENNQLYNINADEVASSIAATMNAEKLVLLTNVQGVMRNVEDNETLFSSLTVNDVQDLISNQIIQTGMIPKVSACIESLEGGVHKTHIVDARLSHAMLLEVFTDKGVGTQIVKES